MKNLIDIFREIGNLPEEGISALSDAVAKKEVASKTTLQVEGKTCNKIYFVEKGVARTFYLKDGTDITYWIATENDFVGSMSSFFMQTPSDKYVETIEPCILYEFDYEKLECFFSKSQAFEKAGRLFSNYAISLLEKRFDDLHFHTARERYALLMEKQPEIIQRVPLGIIASYLGITQETLSRIRQKE